VSNIADVAIVQPRLRAAKLPFVSLHTISTTSHLPRSLMVMAAHLTVGPTEERTAGIDTLPRENINSIPQFGAYLLIGEVPPLPVAPRL